MNYTLTPLSSERHPITISMTTGRCGTTFLNNTFIENFKSENNWISHEFLSQKITNVGVYHRCYTEAFWQNMLNQDIINLVSAWRKLSEKGPIVDFGWTMRSLVPYLRDELGNQLRVLHIHRHPISVAASFNIIGSYSLYNSPQWAITPQHPRALYPQFSDRWSYMTPFEKCLYLWLEANAFAIEVRERYSDMSFLEVKSKNLFEDNDLLRRVAIFTGFLNESGRAPSPSRKINSQDLFSLESRPIHDEWISYKKHPEVIEFAERLGYCMEQEYVREIIPRYQLQPGILPYARYMIGYWGHRRRVGNLLRSIGLRK